MKEPKQYTPHQLLEIWALRITGGRLTNPTTLATGGDADPVEEASLIVDYIMSTPGYAEAAPVLKWVWVYRHSAESYNPCEPGESLDYALGRRGWRKWLGVPLRQLGPSIEAEFMLAFIQKCRERPFVFKPEWDDPVIPMRGARAIA